jgi:hypothetical protein
MKKNLIVSFDTYSWIEHCTGLILDNPKAFEILIICNDDNKPIFNYKDLCPQAVYEQRREDLYNIGKELRINKISNLMFNSLNIDILQLTIQLQLPLAVGQITEVYYQYNDILNPIFNKINMLMDVGIFSYGNNTEDWDFEYELDAEEMKTKRRVVNLIVGGINEKYTPYEFEKFYTL